MAGFRDAAAAKADAERRAEENKTKRFEESQLERPNPIEVNDS